MSQIWAACRDDFAPVALEGTLVRMVESQERIATNRTVDDLAEQAQIEEMIERSKPRRRPGTERLHYLLATPFRYPPLPHGSRFASRFEPSVLYGGESVAATLAEVGYYRLVFWDGLEVPPPAGKITSEHTLFGARYSTGRGARLQGPPFDAYTDRISHPATYADSQPLGSALREADIEAFQYVSARDPDAGMNIGVFDPAALASTDPAFQQAWLCQTTADSVGFLSIEGEARDFAREVFLHDGAFPYPGV